MNVEFGHMDRRRAVLTGALAPSRRLRVAEITLTPVTRDTLAELPQIDLLKMDLQGGALEVPHEHEAESQRKRMTSQLLDGDAVYLCAADYTNDFNDDQLMHLALVADMMDSPDLALLCLDSLALYLSNMILNGVIDRVALDTLGYGVDEAAEDGLTIVNPHGNLGWARVGKPDEGEEGAISVRRGDDLIGARQIDFLKMDVEGMEVRALKGLRETITRCRPVIFIEVDHKVRDGFDALMDEMNYTVNEALTSHRVNQNLLLVPAA